MVGCRAGDVGSRGAAELDDTAEPRRTTAGFVSLLFALFVVGPAGWSMVLWSLVFGAVFGAVLGFLGHWATRGRRDFSSDSGLQAETYEVQVDGAHADEAFRVPGRGAVGPSRPEPRGRGWSRHHDARPADHDQFSAGSTTNSATMFGWMRQ